MKFLSLFFIFISCASTKEKVNPDLVYHGSSVPQYFLSELPLWANYSESAGCFRSSVVKYLDYGKLQANYNLSYAESAQLQLTYNKNVFEFKHENQDKPLVMQDEIYLFSNAYEKVAGGAYDFIEPKFSRIHLILLDSILNSEEKIKSLIHSLENSKMGDGYPVFLSSCLNDRELQLVVDKYFSKISSKKFSIEMFSPYNEDGSELLPGIFIYLNKLLPEKEIILYGPYDEAPMPIKGFKEYIKY